jgi:hypothetical protein
MNPMKNSEIDRLMRESLEAHSDFIVPDSLIQSTIHKLEKRMLIREIMMELAFKLGLVIISLGILAIVLALANGTALISRFADFVIANRQLIFSMIFLAFVILIVDQVVLRFYLFKSRGLGV